MHNLDHLMQNVYTYCNCGIMPELSETGAMGVIGVIGVIGREQNGEAAGGFLLVSMAVSTDSECVLSMYTPLSSLVDLTTSFSTASS